MSSEKDNLVKRKTATTKSEVTAPANLGGGDEESRPSKGEIKEKDPDEALKELGVPTDELVALICKIIGISVAVILLAVLVGYLLAKFGPVPEVKPRKSGKRGPKLRDDINKMGPEWEDYNKKLNPEFDIDEDMMGPTPEMPHKIKKKMPKMKDKAKKAKKMPDKYKTPPRKTVDKSKIPKSPDAENVQIPNPLDDKKFKKPIKLNEHILKDDMLKDDMLKDGTTKKIGEDAYIHTPDLSKIKLPEKHKHKKSPKGHDKLHKKKPSPDEKVHDGNDL